MAPTSKDSTLFERVFGTTHFVEHFNRKAALYLQQHVLDGDKGSSDGLQHVRECLDDFLKASKGSDCVSVTYAKGEASGGFGRWFAKGAASMQRMPRKLRHTLCAGLWVDCDFVNCHPTLLLQLCQQNGIRCDFLQRYVEHREEMLEEIVVSKNTACFGREEAKEALLKVLNGGVDTTIAVEWWQAMCRDFRTIAAEVAKLDQFRGVRDHVLRRADSTGLRNVAARIMNAILCVLENACLEQFFSFLAANGCVKAGCVLVFDGIQVRRTERVAEALTSPSFLADAAVSIENVTGWRVGIKVKDFDQGFELPSGYELEVQDVIVVRGGDDKAAAEVFLAAHGKKVVRSQNRFFYNVDGVFVEGEAWVKAALLDELSMMSIEACTDFGLKPYSRSTKHAEACTKMILASRNIVDDDFVRNMWESNLYHLNFKDGVYSFCSGGCVAPAEHVHFIYKLPRAFPVQTDERAQADLFARVLQPILPDPEQLEFFLCCLARALAGCVWDKRWFVLFGERNSGKGVICMLIELAFSEFTMAFNASSLLCKRSNDGDEAKKLSWVSELEFKRIAFANEVVGGTSGRKIDGNLLKALASGGDTMEVRRNYRDEERKKLQSTFMLCCNDFPAIEPSDALETCVVFNFPTKFVKQEEWGAAGEEHDSHWRPADSGVKDWLRSTPAAVDAFTRLVLQAYSQELKPLPACVARDTANFKGVGALSETARIKEIVKHSTSASDKAFTGDIKVALEKAGLGAISQQKIEEYIRRIFSTASPRPERKRFMVNGVRDYGFTHIRLEQVVAYDSGLARCRFMEEQREEARQGVRQRFDFSNPNRAR